HHGGLHSFPTRRSSDLVVLPAEVADEVDEPVPARVERLPEAGERAERRRVTVPDLLLRVDERPRVAELDVEVDRVRDETERHERSEEHTSELQSPYDLV